MTRITNIPRADNVVHLAHDQSTSLDIARITRSRVDLDTSWGGALQDRAQICREGDGRFDDLHTGGMANDDKRLHPAWLLAAFVAVGGLVCFASWYHAGQIDVKEIPVPACAGQPVC